MIDLAAASRIVDEALVRARTDKMPPMTVAVLDAHGCLVAFKREDGSSLLRENIAQGKAWGALGMGMGTRALAGRAAKHPEFFVSLNGLSNGRVIAVPGGVLIRSAQGAIIGAVGVSGALPDHDEACAIAGIEAVALTADPGQ
jgi:uncharacterized protein GlcG (DUF336 family)